MATRISPGDLKSAARLTSRIGEIGEVKRDNPWKGTYRISIGGGRARLGLTEGTMTLEWAIPIDGSDLDGLDESFDSAGSTRSPRVSPTAIPTRSRGVRGWSSRSPGQAPPRPQGGRPGSASQVEPPPRTLPARSPAPTSRVALLTAGRPPRSPWPVPWRSSHRSSGRRTPSNRAPSRPGRPRGVLVGGSPMKAALVSGLPRSLTPLSFGRRTALTTAAFLEQVRNDVEVRAVGSHYSFTSETDGHVLELRGEPAPFPMQFPQAGRHAARTLLDRPEGAPQLPRDPRSVPPFARRQPRIPHQGGGRGRCDPDLDPREPGDQIERRVSPSSGLPVPPRVNPTLRAGGPRRPCSGRRAASCSRC